MNYTQSGNRRGKPKRLLDPSVSTSSPISSQMPQPNYMYTPEAPMNSDSPPDYGFNIPRQEQSPSPVPTAYGYNQQPSMPYTPNGPQNDTFGAGQFTTQLLSQPIVTNMAMQYGNALANSGKQHIERFLPITSLRYYFAVDTDYVVMKLLLLFFPFTHKDWSVKYEQDSPMQPRYEKNAPDMYIPTMSFLTYVVVVGFALGVQEKFTPETLGMTASSALAWCIIEMLVHIITLYVMSLETSLKYLDLLAYCSYKYVGINAALLTSLVFARLGYYSVLIYFSVSLGFFLIRSLKLRVIPEGNSAYSAIGNKRRLYFILYVAGIQPLLMWWLSFHLV